MIRFGLRVGKGSPLAKWLKAHRLRLLGVVRTAKRPLVKLPLLGCDYVSGPTTAALKAAGIKFVVRYLSSIGNPKNATKTEIAQLHAAGIDVVLVFETVADRARGGASAGRMDALSAREQIAALGFPSAVVYFAVDFDPHGHEATIVDYIHGAAQVLGTAKTGVYGGLNAVKACLDAKVCKYGWQAYAWSYGRWDPRRHLEQYANGQHIGGASVDLDRAVKRFYGAL